MKRKKEGIFLLLLVVIVAVFYGITTGQSEQTETALITVDGGVWKEISLAEDGTYTVETTEGYNMVSVTEGVVKVTEADCPDQLCVQQKAIKTAGEMIVCLPHKVVVEIP